jgi:CelD/BcsL family acetyltransferase involved in cellulose biosynthesis
MTIAVHEVMEMTSTLSGRFGHDLMSKSSTARMAYKSLLVKQLISVSEMDMYATQWRELDRRTTARMVWFQSHDWCHNWMSIHGKEGFEPRIIALFRGNRLTAVLPMMIETTTVGVRILRGLGEPHSQYANILTETGALIDEEIAILKKAILEISDADSLVLNLVPEDSPLQKILPASARTPEFDNSASQFVLEGIASGADFAAQRKTSVKKKTRKALDQLKARGSVEFTVVRPDDARYLPWVKQCLRFKSQWLSRTGRISTGLDFEDHSEFLAAVPHHQHHGQGPIISALTLEGKPIAIEIGFLHHGHYYCYLGGFDWSFRQVSPGKLQMEMTLAWLIDQGVHTFDLLANPSDYKSEYSNRTVALTSHAMAITRYGRVYASVWHGMLRPALKRAFKTLPADVRIGLSILRKLKLSYSA